MTKKEIVKMVKEHEIELIRFVYVDNDGVIRGYNSTADELEGDLALGHPFAIAMPFFSVLDELPPGTRFGCVGEITGLPDPDTFRILPYSPNSAMMICDFVGKTDHGPTGLCARSLLKEFLSGMEFEVRAAFENEFYLLKRNESGNLIPFDNSLCFATSGMNQQHEVVLDIVRALRSQGLIVEKYYPEYGKGQVEIVYKYGDVLRSVDNQVFFRETCRGVAQKHGLIASFMPKPFQHLAGSGSHMHFSLWKEGKNLFFDDSAEEGLSEMARHFIGGILKHIKALCAFTASTVNSYKRLVPHSWASAYACWGFDNREAAVRAITGMKGREEQSLNIEFKPVDGACNPYLATLAVLAAGMDGIKNRDEPGESINMDPHDMPEKEREDRGIERLPETLGQAIDALVADEFFIEVLGQVFVEEYLTLKRFEWAEYINHVSTWEVDTYVEAF
ncbi:MAG: glutamine synthetase [Deltaproteobacteria bacterium]|nr:glutamine synthetase [Deltaproteobacteria bacterium]